MPAVGEAPVHQIDGSGVGHLFDVRARREGPLTAGDDHRADGVVGVESAQRIQ